MLLSFFLGSLVLLGYKTIILSCQTTKRFGKIRYPQQTYVKKWRKIYWDKWWSDDDSTFEWYIWELIDLNWSHPQIAEIWEWRRPELQDWNIWVWEA